MDWHHGSVWPFHLCWRILCCVCFNGTFRLSLIFSDNLTHLSSVQLESPAAFKSICVIRKSHKNKSLETNMANVWLIWCSHQCIDMALCLADFVCSVQKKGELTRILHHEEFIQRAGSLVNFHILLEFQNRADRNSSSKSSGSPGAGKMLNCAYDCEQKLWIGFAANGSKPMHIIYFVF